MRRQTTLCLTRLDDRLLPSFSVSATPTALAFTAGAAPSTLTVRTVGNQVQWATDGQALTTIPGVSTAALRSVTVTGGPYADRIDLAGMVTPVGARISGGGGDDSIVSSPQPDSIDGGPGKDSAKFDTRDPRPANVELWNPMPMTSDNQVQKVKVLVLDYDPRIPQRGNQRMNQAFSLKDPHSFAAAHAEAIERTSGGAVDFEIVEHRTIDAFPVLEGGGRYTPELYTAVREGRAKPLTARMDYPRILNDNGVPALVDAGRVDEVWLITGPDINNWEWAMAGRGAFYINGGVYSERQVPAQRAFAIGGFNTLMFGGVLLHGNGHRIESTMERVYGGWNHTNPVTVWDRFTASAHDAPGLAAYGVGSVHIPANGADHYDYYNARAVASYADDFLRYPSNLAGPRLSVNNQTWRKYDVTANHPVPDDQNGYLEWWYWHLPRAAGTAPDGKQANWFKYTYDFNNYTASGQPLPLRARMLRGGTGPSFAVAYEGAVQVNVSTLDGSDLRAIGPDGRAYGVTLVSKSDATNGGYRVGNYRIAVGAPAGTYRIEAVAGQVRNVAGQSLAGGQVLGYARV